MVAVLPSELSPLGKYTPSQASRLLGVSRRTIYYAMESGEIPFVLNRTEQRRIHGKALIRYFNSH